MQDHRTAAGGELGSSSAVVIPFRRRRAGEPAHVQRAPAERIDQFTVRTGLDGYTLRAGVRFWRELADHTDARTAAIFRRGAEWLEDEFELPDDGEDSTTRDLRRTRSVASLMAYGLSFDEIADATLLPVGAVHRALDRVEADPAHVGVCEKWHAANLRAIRSRAAKDGWARRRANKRTRGGES